MLSTPADLSDQELLARTLQLAADERQATALLAAIQVLQADLFTSNVPGGPDINTNPIPGKIRDFGAKVDRLLAPHIEVFTVVG